MDFYLAAVEAMWRILIDRVCGTNRKSGSGVAHEELFESPIDCAAPDEQFEVLIG